MPKTKLTKTVAGTAEPKTKIYEIRDTTVPGFLLKIMPSGRKTFMIAYSAANGQRRKPAIGQFGEITVEQARIIAQDWLADVRRGRDPGAARAAARLAPTVKDLCERFLDDYSVSRNKPSTVRNNRFTIRNHVIPALGHIKTPDVTRADVSRLIAQMVAIPTTANHALSCLRRMFNLAEVWGYRPDGSNPCRHVPKYPIRGETRLITDDELRKIYAYLDHAEVEGLEHPFITLAIRLQFEFAARKSEILALEWSWIDFGNRRVVWPDSKTGGMSKPLGIEAKHLLENAPRIVDSPYVIPSIFDPQKPMPTHTYSAGWGRIIERAGVPHCGTHAVRHRAATDIANSGVPVKVGMALTAHKTVTMFMRYVHAEDDPIRAAADAVAERRRSMVGGSPSSGSADAPTKATPPREASPASNLLTTLSSPQHPFSNNGNQAATKVGNYHPYRAHKGENRSLPPKSRTDVSSMLEVSHG